MKSHLPIVILIIVAAVLLFANLGNQYLWQDEAETAVLAKNTLTYGFPRAFDGDNHVNPRIAEYYGVGFGDNYQWLYHPWIQFYVTALSFFLFGVSTFTARLPFAALGVVNILLTYMLAYRFTRQRLVAVLSALLVTFSVPYLLLMRQCRYYALEVFWVLLILFFYDRFRETRANRDAALVSVGLIGLGHTIHGMFVPVFAAVGLHYFIFAFEKKTFLKVFLCAAVAAGAVLPWFLISDSMAHTTINLEKILQNFEFEIRMINKYVFPLFFFMAIYAARVVWKRKFTLSVTAREKRSLSLIIMVLAVSIVAFCFVEQRNFRYLVYFIPLLSIIEGMILFRFARFRLILGVFLVISLGTGVLNQAPPNFLFPKYIYEITHDYDGPIEGIVKFLNKNAKPAQTVKIIYGDHPLMFYTDLTIDNSWVYDEDHMPEWIVFRHGWHELLDNDYYTAVGKKYKKHVLEYPDIKWENRPGDLGYHKFATEKDAPRVVLFERVEKPGQGENIGG